MLLLATCLIGAFIIGSALTDSADDDDHFDGGMMTPVAVPSQ